MHADRTDHVDEALARADRQRPGTPRDRAMIDEAIRISAAIRPAIDARFLAHTAVDAHDAHLGDAFDARTIATTVVGTWDMETDAHRDEMGSAGLA